MVPGTVFCDLCVPLPLCENGAWHRFQTIFKKWCLAPFFALFVFLCLCVKMVPGTVFKPYLKKMVPGTVFKPYSKNGAWHRLKKNRSSGPNRPDERLSFPLTEVNQYIEFLKVILVSPSDVILEPVKLNE